MKDLKHDIQKRYNDTMEIKQAVENDSIQNLVVKFNKLKITRKKLDHNLPLQTKEDLERKSQKWFNDVFELKSTNDKSRNHDKKAMAKMTANQMQDIEKIKQSLSMRKKSQEVSRKKLNQIVQVVASESLGAAKVESTINHQFEENRII